MPPNKQVCCIFIVLLLLSCLQYYTSPEFINIYSKTEAHLYVIGHYRIITVGGKVFQTPPQPWVPEESETREGETHA